MSKWLTRTQVAERLGIHRNSLFRLEQRPDFPRRSETLGTPRWREDEIEEFMERGREHRSSRPGQGGRPKATAGEVTHGL